MNKTFSCPALRSEFLKTVSNGPGIYQMIGKREVLYVGKARNLRRRLASYARHAGPAHSKTAVMLRKVQRVDVILTTTEKEAFILEASLIKKHRPRYNVILRDDKNYPLIKVTVGESWPRILVTRRRLRDGSRYFGPYSSTSAMRATLKLLYTMFPLRRCKGKEVRKRSRPCLNHQLGRCLAPCVDKADSRKYAELVSEVIMVLEGRSRELLTGLTRRMKAAADDLAFEKAAGYRDQIAALTKTLERQVIVADHFHDQDVFGLARRDASVAVAILFVRSGIVSGRQSFFLADPLGTDSAILAETMAQYYSARRPPPREILLPLEPEDRDLLTGQFEKLRGGRVYLKIPQRGPRMQLMAMARQNAVELFSDRQKKKESWEILAAHLRRQLRLANRPERIECLDISTTSGRLSVGSLVCFQGGEKSPGEYRHYRIRNRREPDDYAMMREVLVKRLGKDTAQRPLPDLLLLDGGKGQLNVARAVVRELDLDGSIDLVAIAKERHDEGEKLFRPGRKNAILLPRHSPALLFLMRVRDESHRFGITFHRRLRRKKTLHSRLETLRGVGPRRKQQLLRSLGSYKRVLAASPGELCRVPGIGPELAASIHRQLHGHADGRTDNK